MPVQNSPKATCFSTGSPFQRLKSCSLKNRCPGKTSSDGRLALARLLRAESPYDGQPLLGEEGFLQHCWFAAGDEEAYWQAPIAKIPRLLRINRDDGAGPLAPGPPETAAVAQTRALIEQIAARDIEERRLRVAIQIGGLALAEGEEAWDPAV